MKRQKDTRVKLYGRNAETRAQRKERLARALDLSCDGTPWSEQELLERFAVKAKGTGIVGGTKVAPASRRKRVRRNDGYIARNGAFIAYHEDRFDTFMRDVEAGRSRRTGTARKVEKGKGNPQTNRDIALMAQMGTIHSAQ